MTDLNPQPSPPSGATPGPKGFIGMFHDPATLAATGLLLAGLCSVTAGLLNLLDEADDFKSRMLAMTTTVDVGDVAILGIAVALLVLTPDPPGGIPRSLLMQFSALLAGIIAIFDLIRAVVVLVDDGTTVGRFSGFITTLGVAIAAATISFYAARTSLAAELEAEAAVG